MDSIKNPQGNAEPLVTSMSNESEGLVKPLEEVELKVKSQRPMVRRFVSRPWVKVLLALVAVMGVMGVVGGIQAWGAYQKALALQPLAEKTKGNLKSQDLPAFKQTLSDLDEGVKELDRSYGRMSWVGWLPLGGKYWHDGNHGLKAALAGIEALQVLTEAIEPYADILGFQGSGSFSGGTAEDRIIIAIQTLEKVTPKLDEVAAKLKVVDENLQKINEERYPFEVKGRVISQELNQAKEIIHGLAAAVTDAKPALEVLPQLAGIEEEKKYMVMFHNDGELRGTGGFMTAYGILRVDQGRVNAERSSDIYDLDAKFRSRLKPPEPIEKYLKNVPYWHLRDLNLSPDFKQNMELFTGYYQDVPGEPEIDGVIGVDTNFLIDILDILGPVDVPGFGRFSTDQDPRCECPQVVYQLELIADRPVQAVVESRKGVLGPLMREIIFKAYAAPKAWWDDLFKAFITNMNHKHLVFYFRDLEFQQAAESLNAAGRLDDSSGDYLMIVDTNFGGAKANFFINQEVVQELEIADDGTITKTLTVTYTNPAPPSNCNLEAGQLCLNAPLPDFVRLYVPQGSELVETIGLDEEVEVKEEFGKTVFESFVKINPQSSAKMIYRYRLPWKVSEAPGELLIQKQVGQDLPHYQLELPDRIEEFDLTGDKTFSLNW